MAPRGTSSPRDDEEELFLRAPIADLEEKWKLVPAFLQTRGLVKQHTDSFNYLINQGLAKILRANARQEIDPNFYWEYEKIEVGMPGIEYMSREDPVTPHECRLRDMTYSAPIKVDLVYIKENRLVRKTGQIIGRIPIMLRSERCRLHGVSEKQLFQMKECPLDPGTAYLNHIQSHILSS